MALQRLTHIGICVSDLERSLHFYRDLLGFREVSKLAVSGDVPSTLLEIEGVNLQAVYLERDGTTIELLFYTEPGHRGDGLARPMNQLGLTHLSFSVDDFETTLASLRAAGVDVLEGTRVDSEAIRSSAVFLTDPDGTRVELVQPPARRSSKPAGAS